MSERIRKFVFQIRGMWKAADMVYESQRNVLDMTIELANEIERRIQLEAMIKDLRDSRQTIIDRHKVEVDTWRNEVKRHEGEIVFCEGCNNEFAYKYPFHFTDDGVSLCDECWEEFAGDAQLEKEQTNA